MAGAGYGRRVPTIALIFLQKSCAEKRKPRHDSSKMRSCLGFYKKIAKRLKSFCKQAEGKTDLAVKTILLICLRERKLCFAPEV